MPHFLSIERLTYGPWAAFERAVARLVTHAGFKDVRLVGGSGDQGADVVGTFKRQKWILQAKYRNDGGVGTEAGVDAVRALGAYQADVAIGISNSYFYESAYQHQTSVKNDGLNLKLWNSDYLLKFFDQLPEFAKGQRDLREYQKKAVEAVESARSSGSKSALVIMATGLGKSMVASTLVANEYSRNPRQEVLVLAHMTDLVKQLEFSSWTQLSKHCSTHLWTDGERPSYQDGVVFATWQSVLAAVRKGEDLSQRFGLVIVDEAHHAPSTAFSQLIDHLEPSFLVGLTATPWRSDERSLEEVFGQPCFSMDIVAGMQQGYLAEVDYQMLTDGIDWDEISQLSKQSLTVRDLNRHLLLPDRDIAMVNLVSERLSSMTNPRALAFCRSIDHAEKLRPLFSSKGLRTAVMHSKLSRVERFRNLSGFRSGDIDMLISIEMLNEGIDVPDVNLVAFMRVTHSRRIFLQQLGRGLRLSPGKRNVAVLDFVADIRRIAAGIEMNRAANENSRKEPEVVRYHRDGIVAFDDVAAEGFFAEYLADVADIENLEDGSRLKFPGDEEF